MAKRRSPCLLVLIALALAWLMAGCGGSEDGGAEPPKTVASSGPERSGADSEPGGITESGSGGSSTTQGSGDGAGSGSAQPGPAADFPAGSGGTGQAQSPAAALGHPKKPHSSPKSQSGGGPNAGLSPQESATYEAARALCANPDSLQYAPEDIRDDAEALAEFAERFAPQGEEQVVHDGCLAGLKSIGID